MLQTFCIKSNNTTVNNYIIDKIKKLKNINVYLSMRKFSLYTNIIIHYNINDKEKIINKLSNILTNVILIFYNKYLIYNLLNTNYFYFSDFDKLKIYNYCIENSKEKNFNIKRRKIIKKVFSSYFDNNKKIILTGFINFALKDYLKELDNVVDQSVNNYIIEKEYIEFIDLLKCYINSKKSTSDTIYLLYNNGNSILLDENNEIIPTTNNIKSKYLSDINFSENDYCLNALLNLLPKNLVIYHNSDSALKDEFLTTLELIFEDRISYETTGPKVPTETLDFGPKKDQKEQRFIDFQKKEEIK